MAKFEQNELNAAARGIGMLSMPLPELQNLIKRHEEMRINGVQPYASRVIVAAARQIAAVKRFNGASA